MSDSCFEKSRRLRKGREFQRVKEGGKRVRTPYFLLQGCTNNEANPKARLGIIVTKKLGNAVIRNKTKRLIRELFRKNKSSLPKNYDIVVIPHKKTFDSSHLALKKIFIFACDNLSSEK